MAAGWGGSFAKPWAEVVKPSLSRTWRSGRQFVFNFGWDPTGEFEPSLRHQASSNEINGQILREYRVRGRLQTRIGEFSYPKVMPLWLEEDRSQPTPGTHASFPSLPNLSCIQVALEEYTETSVWARNPRLFVHIENLMTLCGYSPLKEWKMNMKIVHPHIYLDLYEFPQLTPLRNEFANAVAPHKDKKFLKNYRISKAFFEGFDTVVVSDALFNHFGSTAEVVTTRDNLNTFFEDMPDGALCYPAMKQLLSNTDVVVAAGLDEYSDKVVDIQTHSLDIEQCLEKADISLSKLAANLNAIHSLEDGIYEIIGKDWYITHVLSVTNFKQMRKIALEDPILNSFYIGPSTDNDDFQTKTSEMPAMGRGQRPQEHSLDQYQTEKLATGFGSNWQKTSLAQLKHSKVLEKVGEKEGSKEKELESWNSDRSD